MSFFTTTFIGKIISTFAVAMIPVIELRGAIPFGVVHGLSEYVAALAAICGNLVPVPFIIIFIRKVFELLRRNNQRLDNLVCRLEAKADKKADMVRKYENIGLFLLVAIPLPGTGAWTGALVAAMLNIRLKRAFPAILLGVVAAGVIVLYMTMGVSNLIEK